MSVVVVAAISNNNNNSSFSLVSRLVLLMVSHKCHIKHSPYIRELYHTIIVSQYNTDYDKYCQEYILLHFSFLVLCCVSGKSVVAASLPDFPYNGAGRGPEQEHVNHTLKKLPWLK